MGEGQLGHPSKVEERWEDKDKTGSAVPVTSQIEANTCVVVGMSVNRASGGNAEALGSRGSGMGNDSLLENGGNAREYDQVYNREESPGPSNTQGNNATQPLVICPFGTVGSCGTQFCARGSWEPAKGVEVGEEYGEPHYTGLIEGVTAVTVE